MSFFPNRRTFLAIGPFSIQWYAVLIITGALVCLYFIKKDMKEAKNIDVNDFSDDLFMYILLFGTLGCRLWFCLFFNFKYYFTNPLEILKIYDGGLAIHGGIIFGAITAYILCKKRHVSFIKVLDCVLPNVLIAQAFGRWGNFVNQECFGPEVAESYFNGILSFIKEGMHIQGHYYMPMFFYESCACLLGFILIRLIIKKNQTRRGERAYSYMMWYGVVRLIIESYRTDALLIGSFKIAQIISILLIVTGALGYLGIIDKFVKKKKPTILFDFDGTLIDTEEAIISTYKELFKKYDKVKNFTPERQTEVLGPALKEMFPKYFPGHDVNELVNEFRQINREKQKKTNRLFDSADIVLKTLKEEGYNVGIISTKDKNGIIFGLEMFDIKDCVGDVIGLDEVKNLKPNAEAIFKIFDNNPSWNRDDVVMIGDSLGDIGCGNNYGAYTIAFHSKHHRDEDLDNSVANRQINNLIEVLDIIKENHYFTWNEK